MGFFSSLSTVGRLVKKVTSVPVLGTAIKAIPVVGGAVAGVEAISDVAGAFGGGSRTRLPSPGTLPASFSPSLSSSTALARRTTGYSSTGRTGISRTWRGPGGGFQVPGTGPSRGKTLTEYGLPSPTLDDSFLKTYYRAPKGYVVVNDGKGKPYPMRKDIARKLGLWKPAKKPPIKVKDYEALKRAHRTTKKLKKIGKMVKQVQKCKI
jgi:hypothetical protein